MEQLQKLANEQKVNIDKISKDLSVKTEIGVKNSY